MIITCVVLHNMRLLNQDEYLDEDDVLDQVLRQEREAREIKSRQK